MHTTRHGHTGREMVESGAWVKVAPKHYRHIDGAEIRYNCNRWLWEVVGTGASYSALWVAKHYAEKVAPAAPLVH